MTQQEIEQLIEQLATFAKEIIQKSCDGGIDGVEIQEIAERLGLIVLTGYDPEEHGAYFEADPGDEIYALAARLKATDSP